MPGNGLWQHELRVMVVRSNHGNHGDSQNSPDH